MVRVCVCFLSVCLDVLVRRHNQLSCFCFLHINPPTFSCTQPLTPSAGVCWPVFAIIFGDFSDTFGSFGACLVLALLSFLAMPIQNVSSGSVWMGLNGWKRHERSNGGNLAKERSWFKRSWGECAHVKTHDPCPKLESTTNQPYPLNSCRWRPQLHGWRGKDRTGLCVPCHRQHGGQLHSGMCVCVFDT